MNKISETQNYHSSGRTVFDQAILDRRFSEYRRQWKENPEKCIVSEFPLHLDIETTNACNLKCPHCASATNNWGCGKIGFMDIDLFKRIIDEAAINNVSCIKYSLRGEPLLHPGIIDMIKYTSVSGIMDHYFNTNGMLLNEKMNLLLIESGLPRISISIDGWDRESFDSFKKGADYDIILKNIENLINLRNKKNSSLKIRIQAVMFASTKINWDKYVRQWSQFADEVGYIDARDERPGLDYRGKISKNFKCPFLWQRMTILWDGTLIPCLMHGVNDFSTMSFGNVKELKIKDIWHSDRENEYRRKHRMGISHEISACDVCSYRALEINKMEK